MRNATIVVTCLLVLVSAATPALAAEPLATPPPSPTGDLASADADDSPAPFVVLQLPSATLEEVVVLGVFKATETAADIERFATTIIDALDISQLARFGDGDVAAALGRLVGVAVEDSKYATVRGLDGRYISATFNGLLMPSTDPQRRDVQLDLFPTNILGGIEVQKSYTPEQLATTTGGSIKILTRGLPDQRLHKVSGNFGINADFTGSNVRGHANSRTEWLGFDNGLREMPGGVLGATNGGTSLNVCDPAVDPARCTAPLEAAALAVRFQDDYRVRDDVLAYPDLGLGWAFGDRLDAGENSWGYYLAANYGRGTADRGNAKLSNPLDTTGGYQRTEETVSASAYAVAGYEYGIADEVLSKTTLLRATDDTTRTGSGMDAEGNSVRGTVLQYVERQFFSQALSGHNEFDTATTTHILDWRLAYSRTDRDEPDRRQYTFLNGNFSTSSFERRWSELQEDSLDLVADYSLPLAWGGNNLTTLKAGLLWSDKDRRVQLHRFSVTLGSQRDIPLDVGRHIERDILPYHNFVLDRFRLRPSTAATDSYNAAEEVLAYYLHTETDLGEAWSVSLGARHEDFRQQLHYPNESNGPNEGGSGTPLEVDDWYPAAALTWRPTEAWQLRLGWSETASYPGLIERSESLSYDPDTDNPIFGNPGLRASAIENWDARLEYYFPDGEGVTLALFSKQIDQPIERAIPDASGSAATGIEFRNQTSADLFGVELDGSVNVLDREDYLLWVAGNVSYIDSEVTLSQESLRLEGAAADGRQLQGQSEWLANLQLGFDHYPTEQEFTLLLNFFDDRIFRIARGAATEPELETGRVLVDLGYSIRLGEAWTIEAQARNLLNEKVGYAQNGNRIESYQAGTVFKLGMTYEFF